VVVWATGSRLLSVEVVEVVEVVEAVEAVETVERGEADEFGRVSTGPRESCSRLS
jgi:hypothetical protein